MSANDHLNWLELKDFTGGLYDVAGPFIPLNAAQTMTDCYPLPAGGVRAFWKATSESVSGLNAADQILAIHAAMSDALTAATTTNPRFLWAFRSNSGYYYDSAGGAWTERLTITADTADVPKNPCRFTSHKNGSTLTVYSLFGIRSAAANEGIYKQAGVGAAVTKLTAKGGGYLFAHQARLITLDTLSTPERLIFSGAGADTFGAADYIDIEPHLPDRAHRFALAFPPSEILLGTGDGTIIAVQGTLGSGAVVRTLNQIPPLSAFSHGTRSPWGGLFIAKGDGLWQVSPSGSAQRLSSALSSEHFTEFGSGIGLGSVQFLRNFVFVPRGFVRDMTTGAWFSVTSLANYAVGCPDPQKQGVLLANGTTPPIINSYTLTDDAARVQSYTLKTAPLRHPDGRRLEITEVEIPLRSFVAGSSVQITVGDVTRTITEIGAGFQVIRQRLTATDEFLDVQIVPNSNDATKEAPAVESLRLGTNARQLVT